MGMARVEAATTDELVATGSELVCGNDEMEQVDIVWRLLRELSVLVVRQGTGSMHRLLSQAVRASHSDAEVR